ncbi:MAG TPA: PEGA domain-containing protein [Kofleriaceae bacterium]|nr:PEGA domain-containing protein [Kofleriaceae bacterium]
MTAIAAADDHKDAEKMFRAGEKAYKAQKFLVAAQNFEEAYKSFNAPELAFSAAQAYRRQYRVDPKHPEYVQKAVQYYRIYLDTQKGGTRVGDAADSLGEMERELDRLGMTGKRQSEEKEKKTRLGVSVVFADRQPLTKAGDGMHEVEEIDKDAEKTPEVKAFIDGKPVELDTLEDVAAGDHIVRAEADGYIAGQQPAHIVDKDSRFSEVILQPMPAHVTVKTEGGAHVTVDGRGVGETPHAAFEMAGGSHVITIVRTGRKPVAREVVVTRDQKLTLDVDLHPTVRRRAVPWVIGLGGVAVVGTGFFLLGAKHYDTLANDQLKELEKGDQSPSVLDDYNTFKNRRNLAIDFAIVSGGAAVAIGLTAAWLYYFDTPSAEGVTPVLYTTGTGGGAAVSGRF